jgi:crossover junction endodeoxyribonuclease RuvC
MIIIGIDPGQTGGVAVLEDGKFSAGIRMPILQQGKRKMLDSRELFRWYRQIVPTYRGTPPLEFVIEQVSAMPRQGVTSSFSFGRITGGVEAWAMSYGLPVHWVTPQVWKKSMQLTSDKQLSLDRAKLEFGDLAPWRVKANDGIAEAALIALWHLKQLRKTS